MADLNPKTSLHAAKDRPPFAPSWFSKVKGQFSGKPRTLKFRLFILVASGLLPFVVMVGLSLAYLFEERQKATQKSALELSRALGTAIDGELRATVDLLRALSQSDSLQSGDLMQFHRSASALATQQGWRTVDLVDASGQIRYRSLVPEPGIMANPVDSSSLSEAMATRKPLVGNGVRVALGGVTGVAFAVRLPVVIQGESLVLSAVITAEQVRHVLRRQSIPDSWVVSVLDRNYERVARPPPTQVVGISAPLRATLNEGKPEGMALNRTVEGRGTHIGYTRLKDWNWTVVVGIPFSQVTQATLRPLAAALGGLLASLVVFAYLGWYFATKVSSPIAALKNGAAALGHGAPVNIGLLEIQELNDVGYALEQAARDRQAFTDEIAKAQAEREALLQQVTRGLAAAHEAGRAKDDFLAVLGHELRNPLAPISMALQLMTMKGDPSMAHELKVVERQVRHMTRLVDDLLDLARITRKQMVMRKQAVFLPDMISHVMASVRPSIGERRMQLHVSPSATSSATSSAPSPAWVMGDEARLNQVLTNLLVNAVKFTAGTGCIDVRVSAGEGRVVLEVQDDGEGMSPEVLKNVFEPFFQERQGPDRPGGGLGLGLAIVKSIVDMHDGVVHAYSGGEGLGVRVVIDLPAIGQPAAPALTPDAIATSAAGKLLVVDDNRDAADLAALFLESAGYETRVAYHPDDALALLDSYEPDLALLDIGLPGMSGYELAYRWRQHPSGRDCKLIALTGYAQAEDIDRARQSGFDAHLSKPAEPRELLEKIGQLLMPEANLARS